MAESALATAASSVTMQPTGIIPGNATPARLSRAQAHVEAGQLQAAVAELQQFEGLQVRGAIVCPLHLLPLQFS